MLPFFFLYHFFFIKSYISCSRWLYFFVKPTCKYDILYIKNRNLIDQLIRLVDKSYNLGKRIHTGFWFMNTSTIIDLLYDTILFFWNVFIFDIESFLQTSFYRESGLPFFRSNKVNKDSLKFASPNLLSQTFLAYLFSTF